MFCTSSLPKWTVCVLTTLAIGNLTNFASSQQAFLADGRIEPATLWQTDGSAEELVLYRRNPKPEPAFPGAEKKLAQIAVGSDNKIYFCSGLDGWVIHLLDRRNEVAAFDKVEGQIRDLACTGEEHTVYYSTVETPKDTEQLADGKIFRRDIHEGKATLIATIRQKDVGGNWWGTFTIHDGMIYLVTTEPNSRILIWKKGTVTPVAEVKGQRIEGITIAPDTSFQFVSGSNRVFCTSDFKDITTSDTSLKRLTDVAFPASKSAPRP